MPLYRPLPTHPPHQPQRARNTPRQAAEIALAGTQPAATGVALGWKNAYSRSDADVSIGTWTTQVGGTTNLYQTVDEVTADDADYVRSATNPAADTLILSLQAIGDAGVSAASSHRVRFRYSKPAGDTVQIDLVATLQAGAVDVAARTFTNIPDSWTDGLIDLTAAEISSFRSNGGFADPRLKLVAEQV